mmetsp:Transcript_85104/g.260038  ORF Transcript_85104/g.260038 Transcript_85104/m.260038 type:complete len:253 (-) Transcript_85104:106-864(-)
MRCFFPSKQRGYFSQLRIFAFFGFWNIATRSFSSSAFSNWTMTAPSFTSSTIMPSSGLALLTAASAGGRPSTTGGLTRQNVHTRSPFFKRTSSCLRLFPAGSPRRPTPRDLSGVCSAPRFVPPGFSGVWFFAPAAAPPRPRPCHVRASSLLAMKRRSMSWSSASMWAKPSRSSGVWMTRVLLRALMKVSKMHLAWYHMIWIIPSSLPCLPCISTRRPMRRSPFSMNFVPPCEKRSRHSWFLHIARPPPARVA